jgi:hypothetical protein
MRQRVTWLRLLVLCGIVGLAAAAACSDGPGGVNLRRVSAGGDTVPNDSVPGDSTPEDSVPRDSVPRDSVPRDSVPRDSVPRDSVPRDSVPRDSVPRDSVPRDSVPRDSVPQDTTPGRVASITVAPRSQQVAVGDSGGVAATLRDAAGNYVQDDRNILWDLSDSTVLRVTHGGTGHSFVVFRALRSGYARFRARYETLSDTGVVLVR